MQDSNGKEHFYYMLVGASTVGVLCTMAETIGWNMLGARDEGKAPQ